MSQVAQYRGDRERQVTAWSWRLRRRLEGEREEGDYQVLLVDMVVAWQMKLSLMTMMMSPMT